MEIQYHFENLPDVDFDVEEGCFPVKRCTFSSEDSGEDDSDSFDLNSEKTDKHVKSGQEVREMEEMLQRARQERMMRERAEMMRQMRSNYQTATNSFSFYEDEEEEESDEEDEFGFNLRKVKQTWLSDLPKTVSTPSSLRIVRTCVTEPGVVEIIVDFQRSNEL